MQKHLQTLTFIGLFLVTFLSSSCFDILEEYYISADGSGSLKLTIDMKEFGAMMEGMGQEMDGGEDGESPMGEMDALFSGQAMTMALSNYEGIHNVQNLSNKEEYILSYKFDFDETAVLNEIMNDDAGLGSLMNLSMGEEEEEGKTKATPREFSLKGKKFVTSGSMNMGDMGSGDPDTEMAMAMMSEVQYKAVYNFDREVKKVKKNENAVIGSDGRSVVFKASFGELMKGETDFNSIIKLK